MSRVFMLFVFSIAVTAVAEENNQAIHVDRTPLTFRDAGLYTNFLPPGPAVPGLELGENMLSAERAISWDSPWSFFIFQYNTFDTPPSPEMLEVLRDLAANGKKVILRVHLGRTNPNPDVDQLEQNIAQMFEYVDPNLIFAITLDEENISWGGWTEALTELYHRCKKRWPDLPVYQWWTPMEVPNVRGGSWAALPADGWVIDLYGMGRERFEAKLLMALETGKPVIHIAWASPTYLSYAGADNWDPGGEQVLQDQIDVCRLYNVPVAYFCYEHLPFENQEGGVSYGWVKGWEGRNFVLRRFYADLEARVLNFRNMPESMIGYRPVDQAAFDWAHAWNTSLEKDKFKPTLRFSIGEDGRKRATWRILFGNLPVAPGTHRFPKPNRVDLPQLAARLPHLDAQYDIPADGPALAWNWVLASKEDEPEQKTVPVQIQMQFGQPLYDVEVDTTVIVGVKPLGGKVTLVWSRDGQNWSEPITTDDGLGKQTLRASIPNQEEPVTQLHLRITLESIGGVDKKVAAQLSMLEVAGSFGPEFLPTDTDDNETEVALE